MTVEAIWVHAKAKAFVDALCRLEPGQCAALPSGDYGRDYNRLRELAVAALPQLDPRLFPDALPLSGREGNPCPATYVEIETYARELMGLLGVALGEAGPEPKSKSESHGRTASGAPGPAMEAGTADKSCEVEDIRRHFNQAYRPWTAEDEAFLRQRFAEGAAVADLAEELGRQPGGVRSRLRKLGLIDR